MAEPIRGPADEQLELRCPLDPMVWQPVELPEDRVALLGFARELLDAPLNRAAVRRALTDASSVPPRLDDPHLAERLTASLADGTIELGRVGVPFVMGGDAHSEAGGASSSKPAAAEPAPRRVAREAPAPPSERPPPAAAATPDANPLPPAYAGQLTPAAVDELIVGAYGAHLPAEKKAGGLVAANSVILDDAAFKAKWLDGSTDPDDIAYAENILGFYDTVEKKVYVNASKTDADGTLTHEALHMYASPGWREKVGTGFDEGVTEYLTGANLKARGIPSETAYPSSTWLAERVAKKVGDDALAEAYFTGEVGKLESSYEAQAGPGSWKKLRADFDAKLKKDGG